MNYDLYEKQITEMASLVKSRINSEIKKFKQQVSYDESKVKQLKENINQDLFICPSTSSQFASGVIINCPTIKDTNKSYLYKQIIDTFECDFVFVLDNERLYRDLLEHYNNPNIIFNNSNNSSMYNNNMGSNSNNPNNNNNPNNLNNQNVNSSQNQNQDQRPKKIIEHLPKSGGVIPMESRENYENIRFLNYFKGPFNNFNIHEHKISLNEFKLLKIYPSNLNKSILTIGETTELKIIIKEVDIKNENIVNKILSVPYLDNKIIEDLKTDFKDKINKKYIDDFAKATVSFLARM